MAEWSFPFADVDGDRLYNDGDFARFYQNLFTNGVFITIGNALQVRESVSLGMRVRIGSGAMTINGRQYFHTLEEEMNVPVASSLQDRTDSVVIQLNLPNRTMQLNYKQGDVTVTRTDTIFEMQIAKILITRNATQITNANITDTRADGSVCGYSSPFQKVDVGSLAAQYESMILDWFNNMKNQLSEDAAVNLQNEIDDLNARKANDNEVVHNTGDESISGVKTFTDTVSVKNLEISGDVPKTEITTFWANFKEYTTGVYPTYSVKNDRVVLQGAVTPKSNQAGGPATNYGVFYLPPEIVPLQDITILSQGSGYNQFCVIAGKDGVLRVGRYTTNGADVTMQAGNWLPFSFTYDL